MIRVITGSAKNTKLLVPHTGTRAVTDRIKTQIFDLLTGMIDKASVLDLFAGSGAYGIEALSRGASHCTFIDSGKEAIEILKGNLKRTGFTNKSNIIAEELPAALQSLPQNHWDLIFCDPPFDRISEFKLLDYTELVGKHNVLILRTPLSYEIELPTELNLIEQRKMGKSAVSFINRQ
jgi:16S rRNA (guanine966-N2)-methyltransferase